MRRGDPYPPTLDAAFGFARRCRDRYAPLLDDLHDLELLGLAEALGSEMDRRRALRAVDRPRAVTPDGMNEVQREIAARLVPNFDWSRQEPK